MGLISRILRWFRPRPLAEVRPAEAGPGVERGRVDHIIILDGTLSSLSPGSESNAGRTFRLLGEGGLRPGRTLFYEEGLQWHGWRRGFDILEGRGIEEQILRAYGFLASHYRPGDRIWLFGYSRGAFAVRSLAGLIDRLGLLTREAATERNLRLAWRHYRLKPEGEAARRFAELHCHAATEIQMIGVWDTVKALGLRMPLLWLFTDRRHAFHNHHLGASIRHGFQALALNENRLAFAPLIWDTRPGARGEMPQGNVEQVWFRGAHADIGGQIGPHEAARGLANIPLVWMLERAEAAGLSLPTGWRVRFPCDSSAPMVGNWRGFGLLFLFRRRRSIGRDPSERLHESVTGAARRRWPPAREQQV